MGRLLGGLGRGGGGGMVLRLFVSDSSDHDGGGGTWDVLLSYMVTIE